MFSLKVFGLFGRKITWVRISTFPVRGRDSVDFLPNYFIMPLISLKKLNKSKLYPLFIMKGKNRSLNKIFLFIAFTVS